MSRPLIWIFGNAVQDITVEVDVDMLIRENAELATSLELIETPTIKKDQLFWTQLGASGFGVRLTLENYKFPPKDKKKDRYSLSPGKKYTLSGPVESLEEKPEWRQAPNGAVVHCEDISWGGGGINVCRFLRALAPNPDRPYLRYTDYAMTRTLDELVRSFEEEILQSLLLSKEQGTWGNAAKAVNHLMESNMRGSEELSSRLSRILARYSSDISLETFLASIYVDSLLFRPQKPIFRRNWVFSRFYSADRSIQDKIICRGKTPQEDKLGAKPEALRELLSGEHESVGAIVLNSLKDERLFKAAYEQYRTIYEKQPDQQRDRDFIGIFAMTGAMQKFLPWLKKEGVIARGKLPSFILIFNEEEAVSFAKELAPRAKLEPLMRASGDLPNVLHFAQFVRIVRDYFKPPYPRIYVTTGPRGSLGFDGASNNIIHVSYFSRQGDVLFDTNACGDAYCAAITLLEWAKRNFDRHVGVIHPAEPFNSAEEMRYFMAVATAAAYCKARDRRGRIDTKTEKDLLQDTYLGSGVVGTVDDIANRAEWPDWIDSEGRAHRPPSADFRSVTPALLRLFNPEASL